MYDNIILNMMKATENAAISCFDLIGKGDEKMADAAAVNAMREVLNCQNIAGEVVIGEGERDKAPMLYIGEKVGKGSSFISLDIAVDPLEGTTICANAASGALSVMAISEKDGFLNAPDLYMDKIAISSPDSEIEGEIIDLDDSININLKNLAQAKKCAVSDLTIVILDRERHEELIAKSRESGAKVKLISDGDIAAIIALNLDYINADIYAGIGGAPEGVLAATALKLANGQMMGRLICRDEIEKERAAKLGIVDFSCKYSINDMVKKPSVLFATGVTDGEILNGVRRVNNKFYLNSLIMNSFDNSVRYIDNEINI